MVSSKLMFGKSNVLLMTEPVFSLCVSVCVHVRVCKLLYFSHMLLNPRIGHVCELASL